MAIQYLDQVDLEGKKVLARFDFNVPFRRDIAPLEIADTTRIDLALESIEYILSQGASKLVMMSHLGRPKGKPNPSMSLEPIADYLAKKLGQDVILTESCLDRAITTLLSLNSTKIVLLENLRFHPEEEANDHEFAQALAKYGDLYVNDAFGAAHRKHASVYEIHSFFPKKAVAGLLMKKEIQALEKVVHRPQKPFIALIGGAKVSDKINIIESLLPKVKHLLIGGAMAYPFLAATNHSVGKSLCAKEDVELAKMILKRAKEEKIILPIDHLAAENPESKAQLIDSKDIPDNLMGLDIGPRTQELFDARIKEANCVLWNGPMGLFESPEFSSGTFAIAKSLAELRQYNPNAFTLVGGGDSVNAIRMSDLSSEMSHVSTGGGASLEYIEKGDLPGIAALKFGLSS